jgi:hypothetical protein
MAGSRRSSTPATGATAIHAGSPGRATSAEGLERVVPVQRRRNRALNELGVAGWCDKAFRVLALLLERQPAGPCRTRAPGARP